MRVIALIGLVVAAIAAPAAAVDFDARACVSSQSEIFVSGFQRFAKLKSDNGVVTEAKYQPSAIALGYQYTTDRLSAGLSMSFENGNNKMSIDRAGVADRFKVQDRTLGFTLFGKYTLDNGIYAKGQAFLGFGWEKVKGRHLANAGGYESLGGRGHENSTRYAASIELGKDFDVWNGFVLTPHAGFDYSRAPSVRVPYVASVNGIGFVNARGENIYEIPVGVTLAKDFFACDWVITPSVDFTMIASVGGMNRENMNYRVGYASNAGSDWKVYGVGGDHWGGRISAGITAVKSDRFDIGFKYAYEGRKHYNDHRIAATFGLKF